MEPDSRVLLEELTDRRSFVGGEIVKEDVNLLPRGTQGYDLLQKGDELTAGMAGSRFAVDAAGGGMERRIQGERSVSVILKAVTFGASWRERQDGIETIQGLNGGLLINAEHSRVLGRVQIEAEDVGRFGFKLGIIAGPVAFEAVRFQTGLLPNPMYGVFADAQRGSQLTATPVRGSVARFSPRSGQNEGAQSGSQYAGLLAGMIGVESLESAAPEALLPAIVGAVVWSCRLIALKDAPSFSIRISLARNTYPAGKDRDWAMLLRSKCCCGVSRTSLSVAMTDQMPTT